ncbi:MAG: hypothetical protein IKO56_00465 [Alphaproteobacteria bacterium]|nr:hypothetical protein [Alphaproteobacteria bacterium]
MKQEDKEWLLKDLCMRVLHTPTGDSFCQDFAAIDRILPNHFNYHGLIKKGLVLETTKDMYK